MGAESSVRNWLRQQPLHTPLRIGTDSVWLRPGRGGAELAVQLYAAPTPHQLRAALQQGFSSAMQYPAGLALDTEGPALLLSRWLPQVETWQAAAAPLEQLLDQLSAWRAALGEASAPPAPLASDRQANKLRLALIKGLR